MSQTKIDRRNNRARYYRWKILQAARKEFLENGFKNTTIVNIAKRANVGYGTVYNHFPNGKEDVFFTIVKEPINLFISIANNKYIVESKEEAYRFILKNIESLVEIALKHKKLLQVFHESIWLSSKIYYEWKEISQRFIHRIAQNVSCAIEKKLARNSNYNVEIVASVLFYTVENNLWDLILDETSISPQTMAKNIAEVYTHGLYK